MHTIRIPLTEVQRIPAWLSIVFASVFLGICAQIEIVLPFTPVPITGQTFGVMVVGALLGARKGGLAALLYLFQGAIGLPVFAGGGAGFLHFFGPTGGYLVAYPLEAYLIGWFLHRTKQSGFWPQMGAILLPCSLHLAIGSIWLSYFVSGASAFHLGFAPFILTEVVKAMIVVGCLEGIQRKRRYGV